MRLQQFLHEVAAADCFVNATGRDWPWAGDMPVRVGEIDTAKDRETVLVVVDLAPDRIDDEARRLRGIPEHTEVVILVKPGPQELPVGALVDVLVAGGIEVVQALPIREENLGTAITGRRTTGETASIAPYLDPGRVLNLTSGDALLRLLAERVVEGLAWRALEAAALQDRQARASAERQRDEAQTLARAAQEQVAELEVARRRQMADSAAALAAVEGRIERILTSRSYRLARALSGPGRLIKGPLHLPTRMPSAATPADDQGGTEHRPSSGRPRAG